VDISCSAGGGHDKRQDSLSILGGDITLDSPPSLPFLPPPVTDQVKLSGKPDLGLGAEPSVSFSVCSR